VWANYDSLNLFVNMIDHPNITRLIKEWLTNMQEAYILQWWLPLGHRPTLDEAVDGLHTLRSEVPSNLAFDLRNTYPSIGERKLFRVCFSRL